MRRERSELSIMERGSLYPFFCSDSVFHGPEHRVQLLKGALRPDDEAPQVASGGQLQPGSRRISTEDTLAGPQYSATWQEGGSGEPGIQETRPQF